MTYNIMKKFDFISGDIGESIAREAQKHFCINEYEHCKQFDEIKFVCKNSPKFCGSFNKLKDFIRLNLYEDDIINLISKKSVELRNGRFCIKERNLKFQWTKESLNT